MSNSVADSKGKGIEGRDCVPYFDTDKGQIIFEFLYLVVLLIGCMGLLLLIQFDVWHVSYNNKMFLFALVGGFLGGWVYDAKWFYRVTARGKSDQYKYLWQCHKFYWRVLTPFLSSIVAFVTYLLVASGMFPVVMKNPAAASTAFSMCFIFGYFSDLVLSRLAAWAEDILPKAKKNDVEQKENNE
ncbi:hypothetical protein [Pseudomonas viridiflava]|uniref:hypothetical protein n=1 Tax=Pseudomonas sp. WC2 TaxID=3424773 RepID=UPI001980F3ED